jgi:hypothetical protein
VNKVKPIPINVFFKAIFPVILNKKWNENLNHRSNLGTIETDW